MQGKSSYLLFFCSALFLSVLLLLVLVTSNTSNMLVEGKPPAPPNQFRNWNRWITKKPSNSSPPNIKSGYPSKDLVQGGILLPNLWKICPSGHRRTINRGSCERTWRFKRWWWIMMNRHLLINPQIDRIGHKHGLELALRQSWCGSNTNIWIYQKSRRKDCDMYLLRQSYKWTARREGVDVLC